ncbi:MAG TPA: ATP-binding cassette domain-containing protein [Symbiobacteriaceae bacterium]|nr:ATP-binding cassette domain-containing protein [Symbiobacteriaceae bacterium]
MFQLNDVWYEYTRENGQVQTILQGVTLELGAGGVTCVVGPSGSGKSSLLRLLNRLADPTRGAIAFREKPLVDWNPLELRRRVALVPQTPVMLPGTVQDNLEAGLRLRNQQLHDPAAWLDRMGLPAGLLTKNARDLSGGEKQRLALARTLVTKPEVLLLDEVTSSLDPASTALVEGLVAGLGLPVVWISHDMEQVRRVADLVLRLEAGQVREAVLA